MTSTTTVLTPSALVSIGGFLVDVALNEDYSFDSDVTDFPVESGSSIVDNIRPKPIVVRIEGIISNTPIGNIAQARQSAGMGGSGKGPTPPTDDAYDTLLDIRDKREPVTITTSLRTYENMALQSLSVPRATGRGDELRFNATFKQVVIVQNKRTTRVATRVATPGGVGNHTVNASPKPVDTTGMAIVRVYQIPPYLADATPGESHHGYDYIWFDEAIGGWRYDVIHYAGVEQGISYAKGQGGAPGGAGILRLPDQRQVAITNLDPAPKPGGWVVTRGRPWGVTPSEYNSNPKTDTQYRQDIAAAHDTYAGNENANPYNPFLALQVSVPFVDKSGDTHVLSEINNTKRVRAEIR